MSKFFVLAAVLVVALLVVPTSPAAAQGGLELGACLALNQKGFDLCLDGADFVTCEALCGFDRTLAEGGGEPSICDFLPGETCAQQDIVWDGACDGPGVLPGGESLCLLVFSPQSGQSELICQGAEGTWLGDGSVCGGVPALPKAGYAALALVLLAGTLTLLTLHGRS